MPLKPLPLTHSNEQIIKTACPHDCPDTCSMLATVRDGVLLRVAGNPENAYTAGNLCRKVAHYEERVYSPDRLLYPMKRTGAKGEGKFERISWDEAIGTIAEKWKRIIAESGPEAIIPYSYAGTMGVVNMSACDGRLWNRMGASKLLRNICSAAAEAGYSYVYGWSGGIDPEDFKHSKFIVAWGTNLSSTNVHLMPYVREAQAHGATFVVIDPYKTRTANAADVFLQIKPGTDAALALGVMNIIFSENRHDENWLEANSIGWRELRQRCAEYSPARTAQITGLTEDDIITFARRYAAETPSAIRLGYGLSRTGNGGGMIRAIACLPAVIGAWNHTPGSGLLLSTSAHFPLNNRNIKRPELKPQAGEPSCHDYGRDTPRAVNMNEIGRALTEENAEAPPIRSLYVYNSNPAAVAPNSNLVLEGLRREDLFCVVHEQMMSDTALYADILLPATTQMEHLDLMRAYGHLYLNLCQPAIAPLGESRPNIEVLNSLAKAMNYTDSAFDETAEDIIRGALETEHPALQGVTFETLRESGFAKLNMKGRFTIEFTEGHRGENGTEEEKEATIPAHHSSLITHHFRSASGKAEFYSESAKADGFDPLPNYEPAAESEDGDAELAAEFPINLLSPAAHHFLNSTFSNLDSLMKSEKEPRIWVNPKDAAERNITDGDELKVWNRRGEVLLKAVISENVRPGVAWSPSLWWHRDSPNNRNVNALTSDKLTDMGGGSTFHTNLVQIAKK